MKSIDTTRRRVVQNLALSALGFGALRARAAAVAASNKPNIVFILADDLGYADLGVYGQTDFATPNLDRLAGQGVRLLQGYANSSVCSPSRLALITGRYQYRLRAGLEEPISGPSDVIGLPPAHPTLPSLLKGLGYRTALFGKWHLGFLPNFGPQKSGYDEFFGNYSGGIDYYSHKPDLGEKVPEDLFEGEVPVHKVGYYTELLGDRAVEYLQQTSPSRPFLLSLHFTAPHWPWEAPGDEQHSRELTDIFDYDGGNLAIYGRMVGALDMQVGRVLHALEERGLADNTIVVFTSDNGGERFGRVWPYSGQKSELLEGGLRVPALIRWPGQLPAATTSDQVAIGMDWLPTLLAATGGAPDPLYPSDGINLLPYLRREQLPVERTLYWRYKSYRQRALRSGNWKYLKINGNEFLFDVAIDTRERANLAKRHPEQFSRLKTMWEQWDRQMLSLSRKSYSYHITPAHQADHYVPDARD